MLPIGRSLFEQISACVEGVMGFHNDRCANRKMPDSGRHMVLFSWHSHLLKLIFMFLSNIFCEKLPLFRISRPAFALFLSRVHTYTPSSHDEIRLRICDPIGNIYY